MFKSKDLFKDAYYITLYHYSCYLLTSLKYFLSFNLAVSLVGFCFHNKN